MALPTWTGRPMQMELPTSLAGPTRTACPTPMERPTLPGHPTWMERRRRALQDEGQRTITQRERARERERERLPGERAERDLDHIFLTSHLPNKPPHTVVGQSAGRPDTSPKPPNEVKRDVACAHSANLSQVSRARTLLAHFAGPLGTRCSRCRSKESLISSCCASASNQGYSSMDSFSSLPLEHARRPRNVADATQM